MSIPLTLTPEREKALRLIVEWLNNPPEPKGIYERREFQEAMGLKTDREAGLLLQWLAGQYVIKAGQNVGGYPFSFSPDSLAETKLSEIDAERSAKPDHVEGIQTWARRNPAIARLIVILAVLTALASFINNAIDIYQKLHTR